MCDEVLCFKVWSWDRKLRRTLAIVHNINDNNTLIETFLTSAGQKLNITATTIVTENDGSVIDDGLVLAEYSSKGERYKPLIILSENDHWIPLPDSQENSITRRPVAVLSNVIGKYLL